MDSKNITATNARLNSVLGGIVDKKIEGREYEKVIDKKIEDSKIKTGVITKYYPYLDKAEVKLDKTGKFVVCKILHRYGGDMIDFYTPLSFKESYCEKLKEPCIIPKATNNVCVLEVDDADSKERLILGYYQNKDIVGIQPAKAGNLKITSITEPNLYWISFGRDGLDLRLPKRPTQEVGTLKKNMSAVETYTKDEVDKLIENIKNEVGNVDVSDKVSYSDLQQVTEDYKKVSSNKYYFFRGDCWVINPNYEASASITSNTTTDMKITGTFRTKNDVVEVCWYSKDYITHPYISYGEKSDYSNVVLEFDYKVSECNDLKNETIPINLTIATNHGEIYRVPMNRLIKVVNNVNHFKLDFEELTAKSGDKYINSKGLEVTLTADTKIPVNNIKYISFNIVPTNFVENKSKYTVMANADFYCEISNIKVENGDICNEYTQLSSHNVKLCENYDDCYNLNPRRLAREMRKLGYSGNCELDIGALYFYEKTGTVNEVISITSNKFDKDRISKMVLDKSVSLNKAFKQWLGCYVAELKRTGVSNLSISVPLEILQCPNDWKQKQAVSRDATNNPNGYAMSDSNPSKYYYSPCNNDVITYMKSVCKSCLDIVVANGLPPILKVNELKWCWNEKYKPTDSNGNPTDVEYWQSPCFYDTATKNKYSTEFGKTLPIYHSSRGNDFDGQTLVWLNKQLCKYSDELRSVVKSSRYTNGKYIVMLYPSKIDENKVPLMMELVNNIKDVYNPQKLDVLQLSEIGENSFNPQNMYNIGKGYGFTLDKLHYCIGFNNNYSGDVTSYWRLINNSINSALEKNFAGVYLSYGTQIRRDKKMVCYDKYEMVQNLLVN